MRLAITGPRELTQVQRELVAARVAHEVQSGDYAAIIFGGARGTDTVALVAAAQARRSMAVWPKLKVIVPSTLDRAPRESRQAIQEWADELVELGLPAQYAKSYHVRNLRMVLQAQRLLAFVRNGKDGGTAHTIQCAKKEGVEVVEVALE